MNGGGGVPIGSFVDLSDQIPTVYTAGGQTFLRSGVSAAGSTYPTVPASIRGSIYNAETAIGPGKRHVLPYIGSLQGVPTASPLPNSYKMAANGNTIIGFPSGWNSSLDQTSCAIFCRSTDGGTTYEYITAPWVNTIISELYTARTYGCAGLFYFNSAFVLVTRSGAVYRSTDDGTTWALSDTNVRITDSTGQVKLVNNRLFVLPATDGPVNASSIAIGGFNASASIARTIQGGASTNIKWSSDGVNWTTLNVGTFAPWCDIAHNGNAYVMVRSDSLTPFRCVASGDPTTTWTNATSSLPQTVASKASFSCTVISNIGTVLVAASQSISSSFDGYNTTYSRCLWYSTNDGNAWTQVNLSNTTTEVQPSIFTGNVQSSFLFDGTTLWFRNGKIYKSTNGTTWTEHTSTGTVDRGSSVLGDLVLVGGKWHGISTSLLNSTSGASYGSFGTLINFYNYTSIANLYTTAAIVEQVADGLVTETVLYKDTNTILQFPGFPDAKAGGVLIVGVGGGTPTGNRMRRYAASSAGFDASGGGDTMFRKYMYSTDGGTTWNYGNMPYMASWSVPGIGQGGDVYVAANGSATQSSTINYPSQSSITQDIRIYKTSDFINWTRVGDLAITMSQPLKFFADATRSSTSYVSHNIASNNIQIHNSTNNGATWTLVHTNTVSQASNYQSTTFRLLDVFYNLSGATFIAYCATGNNGTYASTEASRIIYSFSNFSTGTISEIDLSGTALLSYFSSTSVYSGNILFGASVTNTGKIVLSYGLRSNSNSTACQIAMSTNNGTNWTTYNLSAFDSAFTQGASGAEYIDPIFSSYDSSTGKLFLRYQNKVAISDDDGKSFTIQKTTTSLKNLSGASSYPYTAYAPALAYNGTALFSYNRIPSVTGFSVQNDKLTTTTGHDRSIQSLSGDYIRNSTYISPLAGVVKYMRVS